MSCGILVDTIFGREVCVSIARPQLTAGSQRKRLTGERSRSSALVPPNPPLCRTPGPRLLTLTFFFFFCKRRAEEAGEDGGSRETGQEPWLDDGVCAQVRGQRAPPSFPETSWFFFFVLLRPGGSLFHRCWLVPCKFWGLRAGDGVGGTVARPSWSRRRFGDDDDL